MKLPDGYVWEWPVKAARDHVFHDGQSLCRKWVYTTILRPERDIREEPRFYQCRECHRRAIALLNIPVWTYTSVYAGGNIREIIATKTKKAAAAAFGVSMSEFNAYAGKTGNEDSLRAARQAPGHVHRQSLDGDPKKWIRVSST